MEGTSQQLFDDLKNSIKRALRAKRPVLTHLNADTSWLIAIPYPPCSQRPHGRSFFNILVDPWFSGPQSDVASWFSTQSHSISSCIQTVAELEERLCDIEELAEEVSNEGSNPGEIVKTESSKSYVDVVVVSHEFTDHCHQATLLEVATTVPVFATDKAASLIKSWRHFAVVHATPAFSTSSSDWRQTSIEPLPAWLGISRVVTQGNALYYHSALLFAFDSQGHGGKNASMDSDSDSAAEAIIYSPHGIVADDLRPLSTAQPRVRTLALLHGLHDVKIKFTAQLNLGAHNGLRTQRICKAKYWVGTHDEVKKGGGLVSALLRRSIFTIQDAVKREESQTGHVPKNSPLAGIEDVNFVELQSGESLLLA